MNRLNHIHHRAKLVHLQMEAAHKLLLSTHPELANSIFADDSPYYEMLNSLYENDYAVAGLYKDADIVLHLDGPAAHSQSPSIGILQWLLSSINKPFVDMISSRMEINKAVFNKNLDIQLTGLAHGSIFAGFKVAERIQQNTSLFGYDSTALNEAQEFIASIAKVPNLITDSAILDEVFDVFPDPVDRDIALMTAYRIAPTGRNDINVLEIDAPKSDIKGFSRLDTNDRVVLHATVVRSPLLKKEAKQGSFTGEIRGLDMDKTRLILRKIDSENLSSLVCSYDIQPGEVKHLIGRRVKVTGDYEVNSDGIPKLMRVSHIEAAPDLLNKEESQT